MEKRAASRGNLSEAQIRSRGIKRKCSVLRACPSTAQTNPSSSWGSKRVRTALCTTTPGLRRRRRRREWSNLGGEGPASLIAECVLANDVADYVRFRAVCRPWRLCSVDPRSSQSALDSRFLPRRWIMLDKAAAHVGPRCYRRFLNVSTGECIRTDLPELEDHRLLALTPEGLLLLLHEPTLLRLLNPLTRHLTDLPPVTALLTPEQQQDWHSGEELEDDPFWVYGVGLADASATTVALCLGRPKVTAVAKPGDECWTVVVVDNNRPYIDSALPFAGHFYCAIGGTVMLLDNSPSDHGGPPRLLTAAQRSKPFYFSRMSGSLHLVDNGGELMLVHRMLHESNDDTRQGAAKYQMKYDVYRVDFDARDLVLVKGLGGRAVFMGQSRSVSLLPTKAFPSVSADTLYLGFDCDEKTQMNQINGYNVADGSSEPCHHNSSFKMVHPYSFVDCLSHCIQGTGEHLA